MRKYFEVIQERDDYEREYDYISDDAYEIDFLVAVLKTLSREDIRHFAEGSNFVGSEKVLMKIVNGLVDVANKIPGLDHVYRDPMKYAKTLREARDRIEGFVIILNDLFDWYGFGTDCRIESYKISDITRKSVITRKRAEEIIKEDLEMDVFIVKNEIPHLRRR